MTLDAFVMASFSFLSLKSSRAAHKAA